MTKEQRKIGIELEYYGLSARESAEIVAKELNGKIEEITEDCVKIHSDLGDFQAETDAKFIKKLSEASKENQQKKEADYEGWLKKFLESAYREIVPTELVCPPIAVDKINEVSKLHTTLAKNGAKGSTESFRFAFGAQLNPELQSFETEKILNEFKSFLILSDWLKAQIQIDTTRILTSFAGDFPKKYQRLIFSEDYSPNQEKLIDDYLDYNPTRNRSLDLLPLFMHLDKQRVRNTVKDELVKSRPTYHYRLPNCQISMKSWDIQIEWQRWLLVEKLASHELFQELCDFHKNSLSKSIEFHSSTKLIELNNYVERIRQ